MELQNIPTDRLLRKLGTVLESPDLIEKLETLLAEQPNNKKEALDYVARAGIIGRFLAESEHNVSDEDYAELCDLVVPPVCSLLDASDPHLSSAAHRTLYSLGVTVEKNGDWDLTLLRPTKPARELMH